MNSNNDVIETLSDFTRFVETLPEDFSLSRGQSRQNNLLPSALRVDNDSNRKYSRADIQYFLNEFKVSSHNYMKFPSDINDDYEWMVYAQHYGIPTKLLDFTYSHVISLMFAVENAFKERDVENPEDAEVWFLNPIELNNKNASRSEILNITNGERVNLDNFDGPVAIKSRKLNERINAQNGLFIYFQESNYPLNKTVDDNVLKKLIIKGTSKKNILTSLYAMGIGYTTLYPELQSVSKDIMMRKSILEHRKAGE